MGVSKKSITEWLNISANNKNSADKSTRERYEEVDQFAKTFDRQNHKIKKSRNLILYLADKESNKPWEAMVGQSIAKMSTASRHDAGSLADFLGIKLVDTLNLCS